MIIKKNNEYNWYCNIASEALFCENTLKYIDYDLDIKIFPNKKFIIKDQNEYKTNSLNYNYHEKIINNIDKSKNELIYKIKNNLDYFNIKNIEKFFEAYDTEINF